MYICCKIVHNIGKDYTTTAQIKNCKFFEYDAPY